MSEYLLIDYKEKEMTIFQSNSEVAGEIEILINNHEYSLEDIMVIKTDNHNVLTLSTNKIVQVSVGGY